MVLISIGSGCLGAVLAWWLTNLSRRRIANQVTKAIMEMFHDEIKVGVDILASYIKSPTPIAHMPNESFGTHLLSSDVIEAVLVKTKDAKGTTGFPPREFLKHLTNYYLHICVNVNNAISARQPLPANVQNQYLVSSQGVLAMVDEIIKSF